MPHLFDNLLISSPNGGGLLFIHRNQAFHLDTINTTGISLNGGTLLRGLQPQGLLIYKGHRVEQYDVPYIHDIHDVLIVEPFLYTVGTTANEVLQLDERAEEIRRWTFAGEQDAKHLNCLALWNQRIVFCAFGDFTEPRQYKDNTEQAGFVQDLHTGERLINGLSQPHSLCSVGEHLLLANSESKELREYDSSGLLLRSKVLEGYTRGICVQNGKIYVGLSRSRNVDDDGLSNARLVALDSQSWKELGRMDLPVPEVYSIHGIENPDALPALLAGISQYAATQYQQSINERDIKFQSLAERSAQQERLIASLEQQLNQQNEQDRYPLSQALQTQEKQLPPGQHLDHQPLKNILASLAERDEELTAMSLRYEELRHQHEQLLSSNSWFLTQPIRNIRRWLRL